MHSLNQNLWAEEQNVVSSGETVTMCCGCGTACLCISWSASSCLY